MGVENDGLPEGLDFGNEVEVEESELDVIEEQDEAPATEVEQDEASAPAADEGEQDEGSADEGEQDEGEQDEEPPAPAKKTKEPMIPKPRLDQALRKQRAAEQRAQELADELARVRAEAAQANAPKPLTVEEVQAKMAQANEALIAGDTEKAAALQAELLVAMAPKPQAPQEAPQAGDPVALVEERLEFKSALKEIYERFPVLDENGEDFDPDLSEEAVDLQKLYMQRGYNLSEATKRAAEAVAKLHGIEDRRAPSAQVEATRKEQKAKVREKIDKATRAAPELTGRSDKSNEVAFDVSSASMEEFMALPEAVRDRLLGNTLQ